MMKRGSTARMPASVLKKVRKYTSVAASTTLEARSIPNQITNNGASAMRGMLLSATRKGSNTRATAGQRPNRMAVFSPAAKRPRRLLPASTGPRTGLKPSRSRAVVART